jgi:hypothetical protein
VDRGDRRWCWNGLRAAGGITRWLYARTGGELVGVCALLSGGSAVSFYFGGHLREDGDTAIDAEQVLIGEVIGPLVVDVPRATKAELDLRDHGAAERILSG